MSIRWNSTDPGAGPALEAEPLAGAFLAGLPNSLQRYHADRVNDAKTDATRQRRIAKAMELFRAEKQR